MNGYPAIGSWRPFFPFRPFPTTKANNFSQGNSEPENFSLAIYRLERGGGKEWQFIHNERSILHFGRLQGFLAKCMGCRTF